MSFVDTLRHWDEAVVKVEKDEPSESLNIFLSIQEPNSKISFNIGCLHLINKDLDAAEKAFDSSIRKDEHLAVAFFQRGITFYNKERYEEYLADFQHAFKELRSNHLIDYTALGLRYKLYACDVLHNMALGEALLGHWEKAREHLVAALDYKTEAKLSLIDKALQATLKQKLFKPVLFPSKVLFKPKKNYVAELEKRDYLGKAKVVASVNPQDDFSGFAPLQPQVEDDPTGPKAPETLRAFEGEPHTVLFEFVPETSDELAVVPGNVVFVLQKGADNWASVVFNERRGLVPYNYLERMEITLSPQQSREPPRREPPTRPERNQAPTPSTKNKGETQNEDTEPGGLFCIVKVHFTYNIAIWVPRGDPYAALLEKITKKLQLPATSLTLRSTSPVRTEHPVIHGSTDMEKVWANVNGGRLTLWCEAKQVVKVQSENEHKDTRLVALYTFESSNPEDLNFNEGDTILLLSKVNKDWFEGQCNGNTGIFPASFVQQVPVNGQ